tara:strand:+ start:136 stop:537 length:402 start_codon:yes stop_codon:yes gene_type:complete
LTKPGQLPLSRGNRHIWWKFAKFGEKSRVFAQLLFENREKCGHALKKRCFSTIFEKYSDFPNVLKKTEKMAILWCVTVFFEILKKWSRKTGHFSGTRQTRFSCLFENISEITVFLENRRKTGFSRDRKTDRFA